MLRPLGQGGMGIVYEAEQLELRRTVALKMLFETDSKSIARFRGEAIAASAIQHPNVARVYALELHDDAPFIVMERIDGESLATLLRREGALAPSRAVKIADQILAALGAAHDKGLVHRDVKPSNVILVRGTEQVKLVDFGIAKQLDGSGIKTTTGTMIGTPSYLAPEQVMGGPIDPRTDLWAVGIVLHEMLAGKKPFRGAPPDIYEEILLRDPPPLEGVAVEIAAAVTRALAKEPERRFANAAEMRGALHAKDDVMASSTPTRSPLIFGAALGTVLLCAALVLGIASRSVAHSSPRSSPAVTVSRDAEPTVITNDATPEPPTSATAIVGDASRPVVREPRVLSACYDESFALCARRDPQCQCLLPSQPPTCLIPWGADGACASDNIIRDPRSRTGDACLTYRWHGGDNSERLTGVFACTMCDQAGTNRQAQLAVPGTPCRGYDQYDTIRTGKWLALRR